VSSPNAPRRPNPHGHVESLELSSQDWLAARHGSSLVPDRLAREHGEIGKDAICGSREYALVADFLPG
jgi:hypothetical protein